MPSIFCTAGAVQSAKKRLIAAMSIAEMSPSQMLPVITWTIAPRKAKCQKFQMSMLMVLVTRGNKRIRLSNASWNYQRCNLGSESDCSRRRPAYVDYA